MESATTTDSCFPRPKAPRRAVPRARRRADRRETSMARLLPGTEHRRRPDTVFAAGLAHAQSHRQDRRRRQGQRVQGHLRLRERRQKDLVRIRQLKRLLVSVQVGARKNMDFVVVVEMDTLSCDCHKIHPEWTDPKDSRKCRDRMGRDAILRLLQCNTVA